MRLPYIPFAIATTVHKMVMDTGKYSEGAKDARAQNAAVRQSLREIETPAERATKRLNHLANAHKEGKIDAETYARSVENEKKKLEQATGATKQHAAAVDKSSTATGKLGVAIGSNVPIVGNFHAAMAAGGPIMVAAIATAGVFAIAHKALSATIDATAEAFGRLDNRVKEARALGESAERLEGFRLAASQFAGVDGPKADKALEKFNRTLGDALGGAGAGKKAFEELGLSAEELAKKSPTEAIGEVADKFRDVDGSARKAALANAIFGKSGIDLINLLNEGSEGLAKMAAESDRVNGKLEAWETAGIESANDAMDSAGRAVDSLADRLAVDFAPTVELVATQTKELAISTRGFLEATRDAPLVIAGYAGAMRDAYEAANLLYGINPLDPASVWDSLTFDKSREMANAAVDKIQEAQAAATREAFLLKNDGNLSDTDQAAADAIKAKRAAKEEAAAEEAATAAKELAVSSRLKALQREIDVTAYGADIVEQMELRKAGASEREIGILAELQDIRNQQIADLDKAAAAEKRREDAVKDSANQRVAAEKEASQAIVAAKKAIADQEKADAKMRADVAKGPGAGIEAGTNAAVAYLADLKNAEIANQVMPAKPEASADKLADEANKQLALIKSEAAEQTTLARKLLRATEETRVKRIR